MSVSEPVESTALVVVGKLRRLVRGFQGIRRTHSSAAIALLSGVLSALPWPLAAQSAGAPTPFVDFNAATSSGVQTNGKVLGPGRYFGQLAMEAEGRQAVILVGQGQYVSFTLTAPANAVTIHYAIPDAPAGNGLTEPLSLYVNGQLTTSLSLTSAYSWLYGAYPYDKTPTLGADRTEAPHDFYNDVRYMFPSTLPAGTVVKLQVDSGDNAPWYIINTADFEAVPAAIAQPANSINVTQAPYSADNTGASDVTTALQNAINAGSSAGKAVYLPSGSYKISAPLALNNVTVEGAGIWYTELTGSNVGFTGNQAPASTNVNVSNLALFDNATIRNDNTSADTGFNGGFSNSTLTNVWIQNEKAGIFVIGPTTDLTMNGLRIMDLKADGLNFDAVDGAITSSTVENSYFRNTQDDSIALFAQSYDDSNITVNQNTVISPGLANDVAVYGSGSGDVISNNLLMDPVQAGSCIQDGLRFNSVASDGTLTIKGNTLERCGMFDPSFFFGFGAIWFYPADGNIAATENISGNTILNSPYSAYMFLGPSSTTGVSITGDTLTNVGTYVVHTQGGGSATISDVAATGVTAGGYVNVGCSSNFGLTTEGDTGWSQTPESCNVPVANPLWVYPDVATFQTTMGTPVTQTIAVYNASYETTTLGAITATTGFTVSADASHPCGSSLQAAENGGSSEPGYCIVDVAFNGAASGITTGTLTIPSSAPGGSTTVMLVGSTGGNTVGGGSGGGSSTVPSVPTSVTATAGSASVTVAWAASTGTAPVTYNIYRGTSSGGEAATPVASNVTSTSYTDTGLTNGTRYYYTVSASNSAGTSAKSAEVSTEPQASSTTSVQIDSGGSGASPFITDTDFNNGNETTTTASVSVAGVTNAAPEAVYQSVRWAPAFTYIVPGLTAGSSYTVRLHFAELTFTGSGERVFNVSINGASVLSNFDVYATAGGQDKAVVEQFTAKADALGQITISFTRGTADNPEIAGIEVLGSGTLGPALSDVLEINAGSGTAVSPFAADEDFNTGSEFSSSTAVSTTHTSKPAPAAVYQTCRFASSFTYTIPGLTAGKTYAVRLHFAELTFSGAGERAFDVAINGTAVLTNFDIYATTGATNQAMTEQFNAVANSAGQIVVAFSAGSADNPEVNGIEILQ